MPTGPFAVITPIQAKRIAKAIAKAKSALDLIAIQVVAAGVDTMIKSIPKKSKPRKAKATKAVKTADKAVKTADPLTA